MAPKDLVMVRVLGPVDVLTIGGPVTIGSRMERLLMATLVISANHAVTLDQLGDVLWPDGPPPSRDNTVQTYIWRLRRHIGADHITSPEQRSYRLDLKADQIDSLRFERLVGDARAARSDPRACRRLCAEALALWRGDPFGCFADEDPFRLEAIRLQELRIFVIELDLECELALGQAASAVGTLEALAREYPFRERIWHLLIAAQALDGRRVDALRTARELERVLAEVGLEPSPDIRQLEDDILTGADRLQPRLRFLNGRTTA